MVHLGDRFGNSALFSKVTIRGTVFPHSAIIMSNVDKPKSIYLFPDYFAIL